MLGEPPIAEQFRPEDLACVRVEPLGSEPAGSAHPAPSEPVPVVEQHAGVAADFADQLGVAARHAIQGARRSRIGARGKHTPTRGVNHRYNGAWSFPTTNRPLSISAPVLNIERRMTQAAALHVLPRSYVMPRNRSARSRQLRPPLGVWSLLLLSALLLGSGYGWAAEESEAAIQLRLTSYNIRHGRGMDGRIDLERTARVILDTKPDLVALQEVDVQTGRSDDVHQAAAIGELTGHHHVFGKAIDFAGGEYGNAVLSRFEPAKVENLPLPGTAGEEARAALFVTVRVERLDEPLTFVSVHLHHRLQEDRIAQIEAIIAKAKALGHPAVLVGDLNAQPGSKEYALVTSYFTDLVPDDRQGTYSSTDPQHRIDYLLFHPGKRFELVEYRVIPEEVASDHRPLRMTVRFSRLPHSDGAAREVDPP